MAKLHRHLISETKTLLADIEYVDATIRLFDPKAQLERISIDRYAATRDDDNLTFSGLVFCKATILTVGFLVLRANVAAEISAIDFNVTAQSAFSAGEAYCLTAFVEQNERGLIVDAEIKRKVQGRIALCAVYENRDCAENVADFEFTAVENAARSDAELFRAALAFPYRARLKVVVIDATTFGADRLAISLNPPERAEGSFRFSIRHTQNLCEVKGFSC